MLDYPVRCSGKSAPLTGLKRSDRPARKRLFSLTSYAPLTTQKNHIPFFNFCKTSISFRSSTAASTPRFCLTFSRYSFRSRRLRMVLASHSRRHASLLELTTRPSRRVTNAVAMSLQSMDSMFSQTKPRNRNDANCCFLFRSVLALRIAFHLVFCV